MIIETADDAFKFLTRKKGFKLVKINKRLYCDFYSDGTPIHYSARELIRLARAYSSSSRKETTIKQNVKRYSNSKNRSHTRDILNTEEFDKLPQKNDPVVTDDYWNWD